jgi:parallel beta-helix repeat protein
VVDGFIGFAKSGGSITSNVVEGGGISVGHGGGTVEGNIVRYSGNVGVEVFFGHADLIHNRIYGSTGSGIFLGTYGSATITGNAVTANGGYGISVPSLSSATVTKNVISRNRLDGVHALRDPGYESPSPKITDNDIDGNGGDGIHTDSLNANLSGNHTWFNGNLGIEAVPGTLGGGNWAKHNGNALQCVPGTLCSTTGKPKG